MSLSLDDIFAWLPLLMLAAMFVASRLRALVMRGRGVRVVIVDLRRPLRERLYDTLMIGVVPAPDRCRWPGYPTGSR